MLYGRVPANIGVPGTKASNAAQNWLRTLSRSIKISCLAPGINNSDPIWSCCTIRSIAAIETTLSLVPANMRSGRSIAGATSGRAPAGVATAYSSEASEIQAA